MSDLRRGIKSSASKGVFLLTVCLRVDLFWEPPCADPHAGWCGGWGRKSPGYPITPGMGVILWGESPLYVNPLLS